MRVLLEKLLFLHFFGECFSRFWNSNYVDMHVDVGIKLYRHVDLKKTCRVTSQIYKGDSRTCAILIPVWGSKWGSSGFSRYQNNCGSSGAYVTCIYCGLLREDKHTWNAAQDRGRICLAFVLHAWSAKTQRPPIWAPWLTTPLHGAVYEVWDLLCISVCYIENKNTFSKESILILKTV